MNAGDTVTTTLEFCAVSSPTGLTPVSVDLIVGGYDNMSFHDGMGSITPASGGAMFTEGGTGLNFTLTSSSYPAMPAGSANFGTLTIFNGWTLNFDLSVIPLGPQTKDECKNDGWMTPAGKYKNQGQCVSEMAKLKK